MTSLARALGCGGPINPGTLSRTCGRIQNPVAFAEAFASGLMLARLRDLRIDSPPAIQQHSPDANIILECSGAAIQPREIQTCRGFDGRPLFLSETGGGEMNVGFRIGRCAQIDFGMDFGGLVIGPDRDSVDQQCLRFSSGRSLRSLRATPHS